MEIVEGNTSRSRITIDLHVGKLNVYTISEAKLRLFRDGGTLLGRFNDWAYTLFTCSISFFIACLTTEIDFVKYVFATVAVFVFAVSIILFIMKRKKKSDLHELYNQVISGEI